MRSQWRPHVEAARGTLSPERAVSFLEHELPAKKARAKKKSRTRAPALRPWARGYDSSRQAATEALIEVYNTCLTKLENVSTKPKLVTLKQLKLFDDIAAFAAFHEIDASAWIVTVFVHLSWKAVPSASSFFQEKRVKHAADLAPRAYEDVLLVDAAVRAAQTSTLSHGFVPFRDLSIGGEIAKSNYLARDDAALCMLNMDITYGFHPGSVHCPTCPLREPCSVKTRELAAARRTEGGGS